MKPRLLLHICCAGCTPKALECLRDEFEITGFWFNPNIHPETEYSSRLDALKSYAKSQNLKLILQDDRSPDKWIEQAKKIGIEKPERCKFCWKLRLDTCAQAADKEGIKFFSTTLASSPYQKYEIIQNTGKEAGRQFGLEFICRDLRKHYYGGVNTIRQLGLYTQKYCGCLFSRKERELECKKR
jgi:predicted adenine nucleotide alpha hydrolase (AANH) superfamily ATPase